MFGVFFLGKPQYILSAIHTNFYILEENIALFRSCQLQSENEV